MLKNTMPNLQISRVEQSSFLWLTFVTKDLCSYVEGSHLPWLRIWPWSQICALWWMRVSNHDANVKLATESSWLLFLEGFCFWGVDMTDGEMMPAVEGWRHFQSETSHNGLLFHRNWLGLWSCLTKAYILTLWIIVLLLRKQYVCQFLRRRVVFKHTTSPPHLPLLKPSDVKSFHFLPISDLTQPHTVVSGNFLESTMSHRLRLRTQSRQFYSPG